MPTFTAHNPCASGPVRTSHGVFEAIDGTITFVGAPELADYFRSTGWEVVVQTPPKPAAPKRAPKRGRKPKAAAETPPSGGEG
jgi:hypothetical protein